MKKFFCFFLISAATLLSATENYQVIEDQSKLLIETPALAKRQTKKLRLANGLEIFLISDPDSHESGAALAVGVGSWDDPQDRPGMAHFVEHMLFLGTEKYPEEEGYTRFLDEHGGQRNAFTMADRTVYIFSVNNNGFLEALDRFGQFFISPLFNPSGVDRESKAIHQEYCKNVPLDPWRMHFVKKELANEKHPFHSFCIGNADTLKKISQDELKAWYKTHYSAHLMHLVVYSSLNLELLEREVISVFSEVNNLQNQITKSSESLFLTSQDPTLCVISPFQDVQLLELSWELPRSFGQDREAHVDKLIAHVLGHEGCTSLLAQLKRESLAESLAVGNSRAGNDQCLFSLSIELTAKGIEEYEKVIKRCFEAIASLRQSGIPLYIFDEVCQIENLRYRFQSRQDVFDLLSDYAMQMVDEPLETFPYQTLVPTHYAADKIKDFLAVLRPQTCQYTLVAKHDVCHIKPTAVEKWLGVDYTLVPISAEKISTWSQASCHTNVCIPRPNPFLPTNLVVEHKQISEKDMIVPYPRLIANEPIGKIYAATDTLFLVPEISWNFSFKTPAISDADPISYLYADLYAHSVSEKLKAISYEALMGGLSFTLQPKHGALELKITGYNDKAAHFLKTIVQTMHTACPTKEEYELYAALMERDYSNALTISPLKQGSELLAGILYKEYSGLEQKYHALQKASYAQMSAFCQNLFKECYIEAMLYGNSSIEEAKQAWEIVKNNLKIQEIYPLNRHPKIELANLPSQDHPSYLILESENPANALILTTDCGSFSFKRRAAQEILTKGLEEPFFSELRTRQQTAYLVANWSQELERHLYSFFAIQSSSHDTRDLLARFELFIETSLQSLSDKVIPEERFKAIKTAFINQLKHPAENIAKMGTFLHQLAFQYDADFEWIDRRLEAFNDLTYEEFIEYAQEFLGKENTRRLAICVNGAMKQKGNIAYRHITTPEKLKSEICYEGRKGPLEETITEELGLNVQNKFLSN